MRNGAERIVNTMRHILGPDAQRAFEKHRTPNKQDGCLRYRTAGDVHNRMLLVCVTRQMTGASFPEIARAMGLFTHSATHNMYRNGMMRIKPEILNAYIRKVEETLRLHDERVSDRLGSGVVARKGQSATVEVEESVKP